MAAGYSNLFLNQGETFTSQLTLTDSTGTPYDLTNFHIASSAKRSYYSSNTSINFSINVVSPANGIIQLTATAPQTANLIPGQLVYDVLIRDTISNNITRVLEGQIFVSPSVTSLSAL